MIWRGLLVGGGLAGYFFDPPKKYWISLAYAFFVFQIIQSVKMIQLYKILLRMTPYMVCK